MKSSNGEDGVDAAARIPAAVRKTQEKKKTKRRREHFIGTVGSGERWKERMTQRRWADRDQVRRRCGRWADFQLSVSPPCCRRIAG